MGMFDWLPCCGPRSRDDKDTSSLNENAPLTAPQREGSILGGGDNPLGYGSMEQQPPQGGLTGEQRARIEEIGREVGNSMLPIHTTTRSPHLHKPTTTTSLPSSATSSRPSSPSPMRHGMRMMTPEIEGEEGKDTSMTNGQVNEGKVGGGGGGEEVEVVQKRLFVNSSRGGHGAKRGKGRGRGKGKGKKGN